MGAKDTNYVDMLKGGHILHFHGLLKNLMIYGKTHNFSMGLFCRLVLYRGSIVRGCILMGYAQKCEGTNWMP